MHSDFSLNPSESKQVCVLYKRIPRPEKTVLVLCFDAHGNDGDEGDRRVVYFPLKEEGVRG